MMAFGFRKPLRPGGANKGGEDAATTPQRGDAQLAALECAVARLIDLLNEEARKIATLAPDAIPAMVEAKQASLAEIESLLSDDALLARLKAAAERDTEDEDADCDDGAIAAIQSLRSRLMQLSEAVSYNKDMLETAKQSVEHITATIRDAVAAAQTDNGYSRRGLATNSVTGEFASVDRAL